MADMDLQHRLRTYEDPRWGYRAHGNVVEKQLFDGPLPEGWFGSPADVSRETPQEQPKRRGRPPKVRS